MRVSCETANIGQQFTVWSLLYEHNLGLRLRGTFYLCIMGYSQETKMVVARKIVLMHALNVVSTSHNIATDSSKSPLIHQLRYSL